jgi:hypothetical protein
VPLHWSTETNSNRLDPTDPHHSRASVWPSSPATYLSTSHSLQNALPQSLDFERRRLRFASNVEGRLKVLQAAACMPLSVRGGIARPALDGERSGVEAINKATENMVLQGSAASCYSLFRLFSCFFFFITATRLLIKRFLFRLVPLSSSVAFAFFSFLCKTAKISPTHTRRSPSHAIAVFL